MSTLKRRIEYLLENKGVTPYKVSKDIGISQSVFTVIKNDDMDEKTLQNETATKIAKYFQVDKDWLLTGEGDMLTTRDTTVTGSGNAVNTVTGNGNKVSANVAGDFADLASKFSEALKTSQEQLSSSQCQIDRLIKVIEKLSGVEK